MQTQIAWPLIQSLGNGHSFNITTRNGTVVTINAVDSAVGNPLLKWNPQRPVRGVDSTTNQIGFGFYVEEVVRGRIERVFKINPDIEDVADYRTGVTVVLYADGTIVELKTYIKGLPQQRQSACKISYEDASQVIVDVNVPELAKLMSKYGKEFRLLTPTGASHRIVFTPTITDRMASNIIKSNDEAELKKINGLWAVLKK